VRLSERCRPDALDELRATARWAVLALPDALGEHLGALGCSGSIRALVSFATAERSPRVSHAELSRAVEMLAALGPDGRRRFFSERRADVILAGGAILEALAARLRLPFVESTKRGLRDGILLELSRRLPQRRRAALRRPFDARTG
jgi:exopolyphosphatase/pppGpp-phosphohydrolase